MCRRFGSSCDDAESPVCDDDKSPRRHNRVQLLTSRIICVRSAQQLSGRRDPTPQHQADPLVLARSARGSESESSLRASLKMPDLATSRPPTLPSVSYEGVTISFC
jgi:hypothetical protein